MLKGLLRLMSKLFRFGLFQQIRVPSEYQALPSEQPIQDNQLTSDYSTGEYQLQFGGTPKLTLKAKTTVTDEMMAMFFQMVDAASQGRHLCWSPLWESAGTDLRVGTVFPPYT